MCVCKKPWISSTVGIFRKFPDSRIQVAVGAYDLLCEFCSETEAVKAAK